MSWRSPPAGDAPRVLSFDHGLVTEHYDVIIVGSGAGGVTLAHKHHLLSRML